MADLIFTNEDDDSRAGSLTEVDYKFRVHFRRPETYTGEYGFDWLQDEFQTCTTLDRLKTEYKPCKILNQEYLIPWMSIKNGQQVRINLAIERFDGTPSDSDVIKLKTQKGISFEPQEIKVIDIINNTMKHYPSGTDNGTEAVVKCIDYIKQDTEIEVYDKNDEVIGKLSFLKNDKEYKLPIRVVLLVRKGHEDADEQAITTHLTNSANSDFAGFPDLPACMQKLENEMNYQAYNQAFVRTKFENNIYRVSIDENDWISKGYINSAGELANRDDLNTNLLKLYKNQIEQGASGTGFFKGAVIMISKFEGENMAGKGNANIIDDRNCALFTIDSTIVRTRSDGSQFTNIPGGNIKMSSYIHELGHVLSLTHPFEKFDKNSIQANENFVVQINNYLNNPGVSQADKDAAWLQRKDTYKAISRLSYLYYRNKYTFLGNGTEAQPEKGSTKCLFMDYTNNMKVFTQWQWRTIQESVQKYFSS